MNNYRIIMRDKDEDLERYRRERDRKGESERPERDVNRPERNRPMENE